MLSFGKIAAICVFKGILTTVESKPFYVHLTCIYALSFDVQKCLFTSILVCHRICVLLTVDVHCTWTTVK